MQILSHLQTIPTIEFISLNLKTQIAIPLLSLGLTISIALRKQVFPPSQLFEHQEQYTVHNEIRRISINFTDDDVMNCAPQRRNNPSNTLA